MGVGVLIDGKWTDDDETYRKGGAFVRATTAFRAFVTADGSSAFPPKPGAIICTRAPLSLVPSHHDLPRTEEA
jgi:glutathionyl-hydroquinone reductase